MTASSPAAEPWVPIADALRRDILSGAIPPGSYLQCSVISAEHGVRGRAALSALARLRAEGIVYFNGSSRYAAPAGPPDPAVGVRLGAELALLREEAGLTAEQLAATEMVSRSSYGSWSGHDPRHIREAEAGAWYPREFWVEVDHGLRARGTLLRAHDSLYATAATAGDPPANARVTRALAARIAAGEWPPGSRLPEPRDLARDLAVTLPVILTALRTLTSIDALVHDPGYFIPGKRDPASPAPVAVVIAWSDGTRTQLAVEARPGSA